MTEKITAPSPDQQVERFVQPELKFTTGKRLNYPILGEIHLKEAPAFTTYYITDINIVSGHNKRRKISAPNGAMKALHRQFVRGLRGLAVDNPYSTGASPGCSPYKNVAIHANNRYFYQLDIKSAYQQVDGAALSIILGDLADFEDLDQFEMNEFIEEYCIDPETSGLYTGAPSSPDLFNLFMLPVDEALGDVAEKHGLTYTRYLDDLTFSAADTGDEERDRIGRHKRLQIRQVLADAKLPLSYEKARVDDLTQNPVTITGVQLNPSGKWQLPTRSQRYLIKQLKNIRAHQQAGVPLDDVWLAQTGGINGMIEASKDRRRVVFTKKEYEMMRLYEQIRRTDRNERRRAKPFN